MNTYPQSAAVALIRTANQGKANSMQTLPPAIDLLKFPPLSQQGAFKKSVADQGGYADNLLRPLALRACNTALPPRVLILSRKPWVRLRLRILG